MCGVNRSPIVPVSGRREGLLFPPFSLQYSTLALERERETVRIVPPKAIVTKERREGRSKGHERVRLDARFVQEERRGNHVVEAEDPVPPE